MDLRKPSDRGASLVFAFNFERASYPHSISFMNTNARSLKPKMESLEDFFYEKIIDVATITETWFQTGRNEEEIATEFKGHSLGIITRDRQAIAANGRNHGGVTLVYNSSSSRLSTSKFDRFPLVNPGNYEVLAAEGRITGVEGKIFFGNSCHAPPNLTTTEAGGKMIKYLSDIVCEAKRTFADCAVILAGDFNQWSLD